MKINKTDAEAETFAANLADEGDAGVFRDLWKNGDHAIIQGHFPEFAAGEATASTEAPVVADKPATKSKK